MALLLPELAPESTKRRLAAARTARDLRSAGTPFLVYDPEFEDDDLLILHFPFCWGGDAPQVAVMCSSGLMNKDQPEPRRWCFDRFELVVAFQSAGFSEAFLHQFALAARGLRLSSEEATQPAFGFGDWIDRFPLLEGRSAALLIPPIPEVFQAGLRPPSETSDLSMDSWLDPNALMRSPAFGYVQLVPLADSEFEAIASSRDGFGFFLKHLLPSEAEWGAGGNASSRILQMDRPAALV